MKYTIFKAKFSIADLNRQYFEDHSVTTARHPSETNRRLMVRMLAFALNAQERLTFNKGLCTSDEPEIWMKNFSDDIEVWIDVGEPSEKRLRKACQKAEKVVLYCYDADTARPWWSKMKNLVQRFDNLSIYFLPDDELNELETWAERSMQISVTIDQSEVQLYSEQGTLSITLEQWK